MEIVRVNKIEAASRQLDVAIRLLFNGEDIVAVHTLVGAASRLASDLIAKVDSKKSWDIAAQEVCRIDPQTYRKIMRATRNFLKHADKDPTSDHEFSADDTTAIMAMAVMNLAELTGKLTPSQSVFQLWHLACNLDVLTRDFEHYGTIRSIFGNLSRRTYEYRLAVGRRVLREALEQS